jgi:hydroxypyruvate isomerase
MLKQSVCWWCFESSLEPKELVLEAARIGFLGIELVSEEHFGLVKDHGLEIVTHRGQSSIERGWNDRANHAVLEQEFLQNLRTAKKWQIPTLIVFSGNRYGVPDDIGAQIMAEGLARVMGHAEDAGVTIALELLNSKVDHQGYMADHTAWGLGVCDLIPSPNFGLLYDIYHMQVMEGDLIRTIKNSSQKIVHYHVAGNPGRHEPNTSQELNYPAIAKALTGFTGFVGQEWIPTSNPIQGLENAFQIFSL